MYFVFRPPFGFVLPLGRHNSSVHTCADTAEIISVTETRPNFVPDNLITQCIRQRSLQSVANFEPDLLVVFRDQDNKSVVFPFCPDLVRFSDLQ